MTTPLLKAHIDHIITQLDLLEAEQAQLRTQYHAQKQREKRVNDHVKELLHKGYMVGQSERERRIGDHVDELLHKGFTRAQVQEMMARLGYEVTFTAGEEFKERPT